MTDSHADMPADDLTVEFEAMKQIASIFASLSPDATRRVIRWAADKYQPRPGLVQLSPQSFPTADSDSGAAAPHSLPASTGVASYSDFADLFDAANPDSGVENALVAAYWFQTVQKNAELDSQQLNSALKNLGRPSSNITRDLDSLITRTPRLVIQVRKDGSTKQARKRYKLTTEGIRAVERMLTRSGRNPEPTDAAE